MAELWHITVDSDLSEFDSTVTDSGDLSAHADAAMVGDKGLRCVIDDRTSIYGVVNQSAPGSGELRFRYYINPNSLTIGADEDIMIVYMLSEDPERILACGLEYVAANYQLFCRAYGDGERLGGTLEVAITDDVHCGEVWVVRATGSSSSDGVVTFWVDGVLVGEVSGVDNYHCFAELEVFQFGAVDGVEPGTSGIFYLDDFVCRDDDTEIGAVPMLGDAVISDAAVGGLTVTVAGIGSLTVSDSSTG